MVFLFIETILATEEAFFVKHVELEFCYNLVQSYTSVGMYTDTSDLYWRIF